MNAIRRIVFVAALLAVVCSLSWPVPARAQSSGQPVSWPGLRNVQFNGLIQGWYLASSGGVVDTFRLRRAELKLSADVAPFARFVVMMDPSKSLSMNKEFVTVDGKTVVSDATMNQAGRILQDAYITLKASPRLELSVGQMKLPLGLEGLASSATLQTVEKALFLSDRARGGAYGDIRDIGAMAKGRLGSALDVSVGLFNGTGQSQNDVAKPGRKAMAARIAAHPTWLHGLRLGGSAARSVEGDSAVRQDRNGFDAEFALRGLTLRFEWMSGQDTAVKRRGYYAHCAYAIGPMLEIAARYDTWDPDTSSDATAATVQERDYVAGLNYLLSRQNVKWQLNVVRKTFEAEVAPSRTQLLTNLQISW